MNLTPRQSELATVERALGASHSEDVLAMMHALDVEGVVGLARILVVTGHIFRQRPNLAFAAGFEDAHDAPGTTNAVSNGREAG